ncbi:Opioid-binding protein/cell adhesion molecule [Trachymyrmex cornetzi]|uniref:Opioid-binding protein/cell adhesion molecule n=1 Tax=Trachymyrmex cornetzi TaxID=471704 RepID=A0A151IWY4_9HYME|nr:Opioid-binding protein/cell adhesion molecule [Trachymyrmex cornetzi]
MTSEPLTQLLKKNQHWEWGNEQNDAFEEIRGRLATAPTISLRWLHHLRNLTDRLARWALELVSWVRRRGEELHLLTIGLDTYASDSRFSLAFEKPNDWRLLLRSATERDTGLYECQVSAHPPLIRTVHLAVSVPKVEIVDEHGATAGDKFYKAGSTIELKCVVSNIPQPTGYVTWRHGSRTLNYDTTRGGIRGRTGAFLKLDLLLIKGGVYWNCYASSFAFLWIVFGSNMDPFFLLCIMWQRIFTLVDSQRNEPLIRTEMNIHNDRFLLITIGMKSGRSGGCRTQRFNYSLRCCDKSRGINYYSCAYRGAVRDISILLVVQAVVTSFIGPDTEAPERRRVSGRKKSEDNSSHVWSEKFSPHVKTDMGAAGAVSRLYIANANKKDSGNYSCALANVAAATIVSVHVLNGENPAAMQHGGTTAPRATFIFTVVISLSSLLR